MMRNMMVLIFTAIVMCSFMVTDSLSEHPKSDHPTFAKSEEKEGSCFSGVCDVTEEKGGVKEISYEQFQKIRESGEDYVLVDALPPDSYANGHIEGAISFPYDTIDLKTAPILIKEGSNVIVYCANFKCTASTTAAHRLTALGYKVVDYKGGLKEWQKKGNKLVK